ncbi:MULTISPECIES: DUF4349 domain-containing protein [Neobacillus]|uniref:DUF4349 domain-containing protein n=1 Tax=Neobacillus rhizophilus TaxID=2833579 RepID=A0A942U2G8_9BACI|nr:MULTISPECIES: DUF4349 domain-containing protein [Neobacillus]MBS4212015.1 DUF4349 domain-containing protein [Neobacillus rhizophilus]MBU8915446.1 DUF4349 domain-containing protein [Bacillus sp. FJAT-29953]
MKNGIQLFIIFIMTLMVILTGCSSNNSRSESGKMNVENMAQMDSAGSDNAEKPSLSASDKSTANKASETVSLEVQSKMVIYQADLELRVKKFDRTVRTFEEKVAQYGGYIAESNVAKAGKEQISGHMKIRIPQKHFQDFLHDAEGQAVEVFQRNIIGQDVTEEYVDLESRLKSKRVVEERLLSFMNGAVKTEDLLKISADLAAVQEEIETIEGKMKYLENQTSFSTVNIALYENKIIVPDIEKDKLNTWEKTKKQFMKSTNLLLSFFSGLVVFIFGNMPIIILFIILAAAGIVIYKKRKQQRNRD